MVVLILLNWNACTKGTLYRPIYFMVYSIVTYTFDMWIFVAEEVKSTTFVPVGAIWNRHRPPIDLSSLWSCKALRSILCSEMHLFFYFVTMKVNCLFASHIYTDKSYIGCKLHIMYWMSPYSRDRDLSTASRKDVDRVGAVLHCEAGPAPAAVYLLGHADLGHVHIEWGLDLHTPWWFP